MASVLLSGMRSGAFWVYVARCLLCCVSGRQAVWVYINCPRILDGDDVPPATQDAAKDAWTSAAPQAAQESETWGSPGQDGSDDPSV